MLVKCKECGVDVSSDAMKCPHCGVQLKKAQRSLIGKFFKYLFICFNVLMLVWLIGGVNEASEKVDALSGAEQAGATIGMGIGVTFIMFLWVLGDIILGLFVLFTKPKS